MDYPNDKFHNADIPATRHNPRAEEFECGHFENREKVKLFYRGWKLSKATIPANPVILLHIHGMVSHSEPYIAMADGIVSERLIVYGLDLYGHGYSEGIRGDYSNFNVFLQNIADMLEFLQKKYPNATFYLGGESMGGVASTLYMVTYHLQTPVVPIQRCLFWAPAYEPNTSGFSFKEIIQGIKMVFNLLFRPTKLTVNVIHEKTFRDPPSLHLDETDPANLTKYSLRYLWNIKLGIDLLKSVRFSQIFPCPFCIVLGAGDQVVSRKAIEKFWNNSPQKKHSEYILVPAAWHCIYKDPDFTSEHWIKVNRFLMN